MKITIAHMTKKIAHITANTVAKYRLYKVE